MNKNIPHNNELIPSNEGWQQMHLLLDQHLPLKTPASRFKSVILYSAATIFILILLCISLQLDKIVMPVNLVNNRRFTQFTIDQPLSTTILPRQKRFFLLLPPNKKKDNPSIDRNQFTQPHYGDNLMASIIEQETILGQHIDGQIALQLAKKQPPAVISVLHPLNSLQLKKINSKIPEKRSWNFYAGLGLNASMNNTQQLQPYPAAEIRYNANRNFYFAMGLSVWSPVSTIAGGISKTVYLNDTANNVQLYNEVTTYKHPKFIDIPLSASVNITKHLSVSGGVQLSVLMNRQTEKILKPYDYQMNSVIGFQLPIAITAARPEQQYNVQLKKLDYRFITGLEYTKDNITGGLTYQYAFKPAANGPTAKHNNLVSLKLMFKIK